MEKLINEKLLELLEMYSAQAALAQSFHQPRKEKQFEKKLLQVEAEVLKRMKVEDNQ